MVNRSGAPKSGAYRDISFIWNRVSRKAHCRWFKLAAGLTETRQMRIIGRSVCVSGWIMDNDILSQGLTLMYVGMGTVFAFLTVLVIAMSIMSMLVRLLTTNKESTDATDEEVAAISAALTKHRRQ